MPLSPASVVTAQPDALSSGVGKETLILDFTSGTYYGLNEVGSRIWELLQSPRTILDLCQQLREEYEVDAERCLGSVIRLVEEMAERGLVTVDDGAAA